jgi:hypothetical protein
MELGTIEIAEIIISNTDSKISLVTTEKMMKKKRK